MHISRGWVPIKERSYVDKNGIAELRISSKAVLPVWSRFGLAAPPEASIAVIGGSEDA